MLEKAEDPEALRRNRDAEELISRRDAAHARYQKWANATPNGIPSEIKLAEANLRAAEIELRDADEEVQSKRGDYTDALAGDTGTQIPSASASPRSRQACQDDAILTVLKDLGINPLALPRAKFGKPGVKAEVRAALGNRGMWSGSTIFDKAWERLRREGGIVDAV
jgi:hypothetical protein